mmetsp:Transcript_47826/g.126852  ORF Transcript_47826/g.126852 Transcript_47826/m.126852 type:complete len:90 (-) Transcript_47826:96-365(-)
MSKIKKQKTEAGEEISRQAVKFGIPLDDSIPQKFKDSHHVYRAGSDIWDAKLNQTNTVMRQKHVQNQEAENRSRRGDQSASSEIWYPSG